METPGCSSPRKWRPRRREPQPGRGDFTAGRVHRIRGRSPERHGSARHPAPWPATRRRTSTSISRRGRRSPPLRTVRQIGRFVQTNARRARRVPKVGRPPRWPPDSDAWGDVPSTGASSRTVNYPADAVGGTAVCRPGRGSRSDTLVPPRRPRAPRVRRRGVAGRGSRRPPPRRWPESSRMRLRTPARLPSSRSSTTRTSPPRRVDHRLGGSGGPTSEGEVRPTTTARESRPSTVCVHERGGPTTPSPCRRAAKTARHRTRRRVRRVAERGEWTGGKPGLTTTGWGRTSPAPVRPEVARVRRPSPRGGDDPGESVEHPEGHGEPPSGITISSNVRHRTATTYARSSRSRPGA